MLLRTVASTTYRLSQKLTPRSCASIQTCSRMASTSQTSKYYNQVDAEAFVKELSDLIQEKKLSVGGHPDNKVLNFHQPRDLQKLIDLQITKDGASKDEMLALCEKTIEHSVKTGHRHFFNQLYANVDTYSLGGTFLLESLNTNQHTYEVSPVFILVENYMINKINSYVGFKQPDGVFVPGGSMGNMMPINLARYRHDKTMKQKGHFGSQRLVMFVSADAHYSTKKGASFMGFGSDSCISVKTDARGRMDPVDLQAKIKAAKDDGHIPFFVCATAGTTVLGAFDPLNAIADVCEEHNLWLHVDAAWGGSVLVSDKHRHLMDGVHRVDSILWNFHKMLHTSLQCSIFLVNHPTLLEEANGLKAGYLFQPDKGYDTSFDTGDKTIQCGRKADAFKVWVQWRARGDAGMAWCVDHAYDNAIYLAESIKKSDGFRLTMPEFDCTNICFWYIPPSMRGQPETDEWWQKIHKITATIKDRMMTEGTMMIGYQPLANYGWVNFFRIIICNPQLTTADMDFVMEEIDRLGKDL